MQLDSSVLAIHSWKRVRIVLFAILVVAALAILSGCASTKVKTRQSSASTELPEPTRVVVYDFATSPEEIAANDPIAGEIAASETPASEEERELAHKLARGVAEQLVIELAKRDISAVRAKDAGALAPDDYLIKGAFVSVEEGSRAARLLIGFGAGNSELQTLVQIHQVTPDGPRRVSEVELRSQGSKMPGMLVPVGAGAAAGNLLRGAAVGGGIGAARELGSGPLAERAEATAKEIAERIEQAYEKRGWK